MYYLPERSSAPRHLNCVVRAAARLLRILCGSRNSRNIGEPRRLHEVHMVLEARTRYWHCQVSLSPLVVFQRILTPLVEDVCSVATLGSCGSRTIPTTTPVLSVIASGGSTLFGSSFVCSICRHTSTYCQGFVCTERGRDDRRLDVQHGSRYG